MKFTLLLAFLVTVRAFAPAQSTEDDVWFANEHDNLVEIDQIHQQSQRLYESGGLDAVQEYLTGTYRYTVAGNVFRPYCNAIVFQKPYEQDTLEWARNAFLLSHPFFPQGTVLPLAVASWREWLQGATNGETKIFGLDLDVVDSEYLTRKLADDITFVFDVDSEFRTLNKHMKVADELVIACSYKRIAEKETETLTGYEYVCHKEHDNGVCDATGSLNPDLDCVEDLQGGDHLVCTAAFGEFDLR